MFFCISTSLQQLNFLFLIRKIIKINPVGGTQNKHNRIVCDIARGSGWIGEVKSEQTVINHSKRIVFNWSSPMLKFDSNLYSGGAIVKSCME